MWASNRKETQKSTRIINYNRQRDKTSTEKEALQASSNKIAAVHKEYRHQTRQINKVVHPFDQNNNWADGERINKELLQSVTKVVDHYRFEKYPIFFQ